MGFVARIRRERALGWALSLAWLAALVPIWRPRFLPLAAEPGYLAQVALLHRLGDPGWGFDRFYGASFGHATGWGYYLPVHLLAYLAPIEVANKLFLTLYAAALPASVIALAMRFGRSPWLGLLAFPLVFSYAFSLGDLPFLAALPPSLMALALLDDFLAAPRWRPLAALAGCALWSALTHLLPWALLCAGALPILAAHRRRPRAILAAAAVLGASGLGAWHSFRAAAEGGAAAGHLEPALDAVVNVYHRLLAAWPGGGDEVSVMVLAVVWLLLAATARRTGGDARPTVRDFVPEICFTLCAIGYLALPHSLPRLGWTGLAPRMAGTGALFGALLIRGPIEGLRRWLLAPALAVALAYPLLLARQYLDFNQRAAGFARVMERVPRGASTLALLADPASDPAIDPDTAPFAGFHGYVLLLGGGFDPSLDEQGAPVRTLPGAALPAAAGGPRHFDPIAVGARYDFVLTHNEARDGELFGPSAARATEVAKDGAWRLYATRGLR